MSLNQQKWVFNYLIREKIWKKQKTILTPKCHGHRWVCLLIINEITELDFSVSMTPLSLSPRYQWHRWDWLHSVDDITDFLFENLLSPQNWFHIRKYIFIRVRIMKKTRAKISRNTVPIMSKGEINEFWGRIRKM